MQENTNLQTLPTANTTQQVMTYRDDTIDLIDLLIKLIKRKHILIWCLLISIVAGLVFVFLRTPVYSYVTAVVIGSQMTENGTPVFFENAQTVKSKLVTAYIPQVLQDYAKAHPDNLSIKNYKINVSVPKQSDLLVIGANGKQSQAEALLDVEGRILAALVKDHGRILSVIRSSIVKEKADAEAELAHLKNDIVFEVIRKKFQAKLVAAQTHYQRIHEPDFVKVKRKVLENKLKQVQNRLGLLVDQNKKLKADMGSLKLAETRMAEKVETIKRQAQQSLSKREQASNVDDPTQAMTLLMIDSEIQQTRQFLTELEQRLYIDMADQLSEIQVLVKNNRREQEAVQARISKIELDIQNFDKDLDLDGAPALAEIEKINAELAGIQVDRQRNIQQQIQKIQDLNIQIDNLSPTRSVSPPMQSLNPKDVSKLKTLVIFALLGTVVGFVLIIVLEMTDRAKLRMRELEASG